jgi:hypothetical protein
MSSPGLLALLLVLSSCRGHAPPVADRESGLSALGRFPDLERQLQTYADGRRAEIRALERWLDLRDTTRSGALDSIGAAESAIGVERYGRLAGEVDRALVRWGAAGKLDSRLRGLDSLRVRRRVLLVRLMTTATGSDR